MEIEKCILKYEFCVGMQFLPARVYGCNKNPFIQKWIKFDKMKRIETYKIIKLMKLENH